MKLTVLGSGTFISGPERATTGFALQLPSQTIAIDLGTGCFKNMQKAGIDYSKISNLFFTHFEHPGHINDLSAFLFARKGLAMLGLAGKNQINLFGGPGFNGFVESLIKTYLSLQSLPFKLSISELEQFGTKKFPDFMLTTKAMKHVQSSLGFRFEANGKSVAFSGDTEPNENLVDLAKDADLLVAECNYAEKKGEGHMNAEQAAEIAVRASAKALLLHHFSPEAENKDINAIAAKKFNGKIYIAEDLMQVKI